MELQEGFHIYIILMTESNFILQLLLQNLIFSPYESNIMGRKNLHKAK